MVDGVKGVSLAKGEKKDFERLTYSQITYLMELEKTEHRQGAITRIAEKCGVKQPAVSRFFKTCVENGYLTEELKFTPLGSTMLAWHKKIIQKADRWLKERGAVSGREDMIRGLIAYTSYHDLEKLFDIRTGRRESSEAGRAEEPVRDIRELLEYGRFEVAISIYKLQSGKMELSMADRGFSETALLRNTKRSSCLELTIREASGISRMDGKKMSGHLASLKYNMHGTLKKADIKDGKVRIPLEACSFRNFDRGILRGIVEITVTTNASELHMPESTACLVFNV